MNLAFELLNMSLLRVKKSIIVISLIQVLFEIDLHARIHFGCGGLFNFAKKQLPFTLHALICGYYYFQDIISKIHMKFFQTSIFFWYSSIFSFNSPISFADAVESLKDATRCSRSSILIIFGQKWKSEQLVQTASKASSSPQPQLRVASEACEEVRKGLTYLKVRAG